MESDKFDNLVRGAFEGASRRNVVRVGVGALAASALVTMGLRAEDVDAKKKKRKKKKVKCTSTTPVTCGDGCCPSNYGLCCTDSFFPTGTPNSTSCNPSSNTCCPVEQGGGSCRAGESCCAPSRFRPYGSCAGTNEVCCSAATGGGVCEKEFPVCCPPNPANTDDEGNCCKTGETCCTAGGAACPTGSTCSASTPGYTGCCVKNNEVDRTHRAGRGGRARDGFAVS